MYYSVLCITLLFAVFSNAERVNVNIPKEYLPDMFKATAECIAENGLETSIIEKILNWDFQDSENIRKYIYCALIKTGYGDEKGHYITKNMLKLVGDHELKGEYEKAIDECNKIQGKDEYETVYKATICLHDTAPIWLKI